MKRFIRYLYEYEQEKRIRNVGFVKVEAGDEETIVHMQGKGFHNYDDRKLVLYLFYENAICVRQQEVELKSPVMSWHFRYTPMDTGIPENYPKIRGLLIQTGSGRKIAASWDDQPVNVENVKMFEIPELPVESDVEVKQPEKVEEPSRRLTKIKRQELAKFPRCEWRLANNHFLIHGYENYRHLVLIEEEQGCKLGVPGIYHEKEAKAAEAFGFGEFLSVENVDIVLTDEERHMEEPFGYWCRPIKKRANKGE